MQTAAKLSNNMLFSKVRTVFIFLRKKLKKPLRNRKFFVNLSLCNQKKSSKMNRILFLFLYIFPLYLFAQEKIYIDGEGNTTVKEKAKYYRVISEKGGHYHVKDFFLSGKLQMDAYTTRKKFRSIEELVGKFTFYFENGKVEIQGEEENGNLSYRVYDEKGRLDTFYKKEGENTYIETYNYADNAYVKDKKEFNVAYFQENAKVKKRIQFDDDMKKARIESDYDENDNVNIKYYDEEGKLIGSRYIKESEAQAGIEVDYYHYPTEVKTITQWDAIGNIVDEKTYYRSRKLFSDRKNQQEDVLVTFFDPKGKKMGELIYKYNEPYAGEAYTLDDEGHIEEKSTYKLGYIEQSIAYYKNGNIKQQTDYSIHHDIDKITYYNKNKKIIKGELFFKEGACYEGYLYNDLEKNDSYILYNKGEFAGIKQIDENNILRYYKEKQKNGQINAEIYNEKGEKEYIYTIIENKNENTDTIDTVVNFKQYEKGKEINSGSIKNKILQKGSIKLKNKWNEKLQYFYVVKDRKIIMDYILNDKVLKTTELNTDFSDFGENYLNHIEEFIITEDSFEPYVMLPSYIFDTNNNPILEH